MPNRTTKLSKSQQLLTAAAQKAAERLRSDGWKQKEYLSAGVIALEQAGAEDRMRFKKLACEEDYESPIVQAARYVTTVKFLTEKDKHDLNRLIRLLADTLPNESGSVGGAAAADEDADAAERASEAARDRHHHRTG